MPSPRPRSDSDDDEDIVFEGATPADEKLAAPQEVIVSETQLSTENHDDISDAFKYEDGHDHINQDVSGSR